MAPQLMPASGYPVAFRRRPRSIGQEGFALPLAGTASLVLLLSSLSLQTVALQNHARVRAQWRQRQQSDALASAVQLLAVQLEGRGQCLLFGSSEACGSDPDLAQLLPDSAPARVIHWTQIAPGRAQVRLQLRKSAVARSFAVGFDPTSGRVLQLRSLGQ